MRNFVKIMFVFLLILGFTAPLNAENGFTKGPIKPIGMQTLQVSGALKNIELLAGQVSLQPLEKQQLDTGTKQLINQNFSARVNQSFAVQPRVNVLSREGGKIRAEALVVFLAKNDYSAKVSKLEYEMEGDKATLKNKIDDFVPRIEAIRTPTAINPTIIKLKSDLLKNLQLTLPQGVGPKALANTPCADFPSAVDGTNKVDNVFKQAFGLSDKFIGSASTKPAVMNILQNSTRLLAWNNIGHGNPSCVVEWNSDPIWNTDFNAATTFSGIYNSVILLNSCNTCASPYNLKNAILQHHPRTYIAGIISLPVGSSEYVDVDFWNKTLLQGQTMGTALNQASAAHGLTGAFCMDGYNGKFAEVEAAKFTEDCIPFNPATVQAQLISGHWKVVSGSMWMLDFGTSQANAQKAVNIIKHYNMDKQCFVGRPNAPMMYFTVAGKAPQGAFAGEDAVSFNPANVTAANINGSWKVVDGAHWMLDFGAKEADARIAVEVIKFYGFTQMCFVGRPNAPMMYFRK